MTPQRLKQIGRQLYGENFYEPLAVDLAVSLRSLQRWCSGARPVPDLESELAALCHERARELAKLADELA